MNLIKDWVSYIKTPIDYSSDYIELFSSFEIFF